MFMDGRIKITLIKISSSNENMICLKGKESVYNLFVCICTMCTCGSVRRSIHRSIFPILLRVQPHVYPVIELVEQLFFRLSNADDVMREVGAVTDNSLTISSTCLFIQTVQFSQFSSTY